MSLRRHETLVQPILPGWVLGGVVNVNETNSSAPDTERDIVAAHSYGRQLGRILDAVAELISEEPQARQNSKPFRELLQLRRDINDIKLAAAAKRINRVAADLSALKVDRPEEYERTVAKLRDILKDA